jgi:NAD+ diphosphatase
MKMNYCMECGTALQIKEHGAEGLVPYCEHCAAFRYPVFNTAVSLLVTDEAGEKVILIRQYGRPHYILVAGYVNRGEDAEDAGRRELLEELGLTAKSLRFNRSRYFPPSNTLMLNFTVTVSSEQVRPNSEVDGWRWFTLDEARAAIKPNSLARAFLLGWLDGEYRFPEYRTE